MEDVAVSTSDSQENKIFFSYQLPSRDQIKQAVLSAPGKNDIFIAYAPEDNSFVRMLDSAIRRQGFDPWIDWEDILDGVDHEQQIKAGIRAADAFVCIVSQASVESELLATELNFALEHNKLVIPVLWQLAAGNAAIPQCCRSCIWMPIERHGADNLFDQLAKTIIHIQTYARLLARAMEWDREERIDKLLLQSRDLDAVLQRKTWLKQNLQDAFAFTSLQSELLDASAQRIREKAESKHVQPDIFISYSRKDQEFVKDLCHALKQQNWNLWVDWENIPVSADWWREVQEGIQAAHTFLFVISPDSVNSEYCKDEILEANKLNKRRIPVLWRAGFDKTLYKATQLDSLQRVSFAEELFENSMQALLVAIATKNLPNCKKNT